jgi:multidrug resistance efflux pump
LICNYPSRLGHTVSRCARRDFPISRLTSDQHDSTVAGLHLLPAPHQQRDLFLRTCGHSPARMQLTTRNLARLRELYKNLAISQRELDQAASDQQTAKAICGRRCQQEARLPRPPS